MFPFCTSGHLCISLAAVMCSACLSVLSACLLLALPLVRCTRQARVERGVNSERTSPLRAHTHRQSVVKMLLPLRAAVQSAHRAVVSPELLQTVLPGLQRTLQQRRQHKQQVARPDGTPSRGETEDTSPLLLSRGELHASGWQR